MDYTPINIADLNDEITKLEWLYLGQKRQKQCTLHEASMLRKFSQEAIAATGHKHGIYQFVTLELVTALKKLTAYNHENTIEIGSGRGDLAHHMGILGTDNYLQERPDVKAQYAIMQQPTIPYGEDVEPLSFTAAVSKYQPDNVVGSWITHRYNAKKHNLKGSVHGLDIDWLVKQVNLVALCCNDYTHIYHRRQYRGMKKMVVKGDWLVTRTAKKQSNDYLLVIYRKEPEGLADFKSYVNSL